MRLPVGIYLPTVILRYICQQEEKMIELNEIESKYLNLMEDEISIKEFENWINKAKWLESELDEDEYKDLLSVNYNTPSSKNKIGKILKNRINEGKIQTIKFLRLLHSIIVRDGKEGESLMRMYDLYCTGYWFLEDLGLGIGLFIEVPLSYKYEVLNYNELSEKQKEELVNIAYPKAKELAEELKNWIIKGKLILIGEKEPELNRLQYIDNRTEKDKVSRIWEVTARDVNTNEIIAQRNILLDQNGNFIGDSKSPKK
jgi:hypothetical protein